jgi:hypothetical protein
MIIKIRPVANLGDFPADAVDVILHREVFDSAFELFFHLRRILFAYRHILPVGEKHQLLFTRYWINRAAGETTQAPDCCQKDDLLQLAVSLSALSFVEVSNPHKRPLQGKSFVFAKFGYIYYKLIFFFWQSNLSSFALNQKRFRAAENEMAQHEPCDQCDEKLRCREAFSRLGNAPGRSIVRNVLVAFVLPLVVFIGALMLAQQFLAVRIESDNLRTALAVLLALGAAVVCVAAARIVSKWLGKN